MAREKRTNFYTIIRVGRSLVNDSPGIPAEGKNIHPDIYFDRKKPNVKTNIALFIISPFQFLTADRCRIIQNCLSSLSYLYPQYIYITDIVVFLIANHANVNTRDENGETPLSWATYNYRKEATENLTEVIELLRNKY